MLPVLTLLIVSSAVCSEVDEFIALQTKLFALMDAGKYAEAEPLAKQLLARAERVFVNEPRNLSIAITDVASLYERQGRYREAESLYRRALALREKVLGPDHVDVGAALGNLANALSDQARHAESEALYKRAIAILEKARGPEHPDVGLNLNNLGNLYTSQRRYAEAESVYKRSLAIREKTLGSNHAFVALTLNGLGNVYLQQQRYTDAESYFKRSLSIREKTLGRDHPEVGQSLNNLGSLYRELGRFEEADRLYRLALVIWEKGLGPAHPNVATVLNGLAMLYDDQGRYSEAEPLYKRSLAIVENVLGPWHPEVAVGLNNLAVVYANQKRHAEEEALHKRALSIREKVYGLEHPAVADSLSNLASTYMGQSRYDEAESCIRRSLAIREKSLSAESTDIADLVGKLADLNMIRERYDDAEDLHKRALAMRKKVFGDTHPIVAYSISKLAILYGIQGRFDEAVPLFKEAISVGDKVGVAAGDQSSRHHLLALSEWLQGNRKDAIVDLEEAIRLADQQRGHLSGSEQDVALGFSRFGSIYDSMVAWQQELNDVPAAFAAMERGQARSLVDQLATAGTDLLAGLSAREAAGLRERNDTARARVIRLEHQLSSLSTRIGTTTARPAEIRTVEEELKKAREAAQQAYRDLRGASPALRLAAGNDFSPIPIETMGAHLAKGNTLLLRYYSGQERLYLLVGRPDAPPRLISLAVDEDLARQMGLESGPISEARLASLLFVDGQPLPKLLSHPTTAPKAHQRLAALWRILIPEDERALLGSNTLKNLTIIPDGLLSTLPFEALVVEGPEDPQFMIDIAPPINYGPSATVLHNLAGRQASATPKDLKPVLTVGNPAYPEAAAAHIASRTISLEDLTSRSRYSQRGGQLSRLPFSGTESNWVADVFGKAGTPAGKLIGNDATEAGMRYNVAGRKIVHVACHGLVDQSYGNLFGALALTPGKDAATNVADDGFLTLSEIYELDLKACELAILSACETNYGPHQKGEGNWALSRGFLVAGARRVVASNWLVDDEAAASLISYFCAALAQAEKGGEKADYAKALHDAKKWVRQQDKWKSPYYWGTFVLVGPN